MNKDFSGKRLLILGGAIQCMKVVTAAKALGVYTIVTDISAHPEVIEAANECLPFSVMDVEEIYQWCLKHPVDGILNFCVDPAQKTHQILCERFGFPCYGTAEQYHILTDKTAFKKLCIENGVDVIPEYDENCLDSVEYPVLVKPAESSGSRGTAVCRCKEELLAALEGAKREAKNGKAIIEKYLYGKPDFSMSYLIIDSHPYLYRTLDRFVGRPEDNLNRQCICAHCPSRFTDMYLSNVHGRVTKMLESLKLKNATVFMQGFVDGNTVRFYDPGLRFPGSEYERIIKYAIGVDVPSAYVQYALGRTLTPLASQIEDCYLLNGKCGLQLFLPVYPGKLSFLSGIDEVRKLPGVVSLVQKHSIGDIIPDSGDVKQRMFEIGVVVENTEKSIAELVKKIGELIIIQNDKGENMLAPLIDMKRMYV